MTRASLALALVALLALGGAAAAEQQRNLLWAGDPGFNPSTPNPPADPAGFISGLNLVANSRTGRTLSDSVATDETSLANTRTNVGGEGWSDTFTLVDATGSTTRGRSNGITMKSEAADTLMQSYMWLPDTQDAVVYKINTVTNTIVGAFQTKPTGKAGNPATVAVTADGDAWVGNAFTFLSNETGSLTKIQLDEESSCGGTTSSSSTPSPWPLGTVADATDACIKVWTDLGAPGGVTDPDAKDYAISAIVADGADNIWTIAVDESVRFEGLLTVYKTAPDGTTTKEIDGYFDPNRILSGDNLAANNDGPGAIGGSGAVVDRWGFLWSGGGTYVKGVGKDHLVIRMDTSNPASGIEYYSVPHEAQGLALDNKGNLWVAGAGGATLLQIDPGTIGPAPFGTLAGDSLIDTSSGDIVITTVDLVALQTSAGTDCADDACCEEGNYNTGVVVTRDTGDVYIANECLTGEVAHLDSSGDAVGSGIIDIGSFPSAIQTSAANVVYVPTVVATGPDITATTSVIMTISGSTAATALTAAGTPFLGGNGDMTGRSTAQPPATATWTWVHDTSIADYAKWVDMVTSYQTFNATVSDTNDVPTPFTMVVQTSDSATGPWAPSGPTELTDDGSDNSPAPADGRYIRYSATFTRTAKIEPEIGPQAYGLHRYLTQVKLLAENQIPIATCKETLAIADAPDDQTDATYGSGAQGRFCGAPLNSQTAINDGSTDPDTAELDSIIPIQPTTSFYDKSQYILTDTNDRFTPSTLTVTDQSEGLQNTCQANVNIRDTTAPVWKSVFNLRNSTAPKSRDLADVDVLCIWPPNFKYFCWLDIMSNTNDQILPLYDNCAGGVPIGKQAVGTNCVDSDPRTVAGDCVLYQDGSKYNLCVKAQRRTVYTNKARVYQVNIPVTDASSLQTDPETGIPTGDSDVATTFSRQIRIPPLWNFNPQSDCPRPTYKTSLDTDSSGTGSASNIFYTNSARRK